MNRCGFTNLVKNADGSGNGIPAMDTVSVVIMGLVVLG